MKYLKSIFVSTALSVLFGISLAHAEEPTFDCKSSKLSSMEELICKNAELSALDRELADVFTAAKVIDSKTVDRTLVTEQRGWIKGRNDCWKETDNKACIKDLYIKRISELQAKYRLLSPVSTIFYDCENNPSNQLVVSYFAAKLKTAIVEYGDSTFILFPISNEKQNEYQGGNQILTLTDNNSVLFVPEYEAKSLTCIPRETTKAKIDPSWDVDGDGVNDCEKDGSCDHTVDYTKQKMR